MNLFTVNDCRAAESPPAREVLAPRGRTFIAPASRSFLASKWIFDVAVAGVLLFLTAPVIFLAMCLIKLTSRGPALYTQTRLGKDGKPFVIYKLRSMVHKCESLTGARWSTPGDPRITTLGRIFRKTHIDELPQLWNVLAGDMSLVGPRPERPEFVPQLEHAIAHYRSRLSMKPGVTGLAQVQLPPDTDLASVRLKLAYDLYYVRHANIWFDLRIVFATGSKLIAMPFWFIRALFGFPLRQLVEEEYNRAPVETKVLSARVQTA
jgi:lipopolysaccharide/colanic/teichoic acid biosynthesis glycosyltransferase